MSLKIDTYRSGPFVFSCDYNPALNELIARAETLNEGIADLPILPDAAAKLDEELVIHSIHGTAAIEGNPLSETEVAQELSTLELSGDALIDNHRREISNLKNAYTFLKTLPNKEAPIPSTDEIKNIHKRITEGLVGQPYILGYYRSVRVEVGDKKHGGVYTPPKCLDDITLLMNNLVDWLTIGEASSQPPLVKAALMHYYIGRIHPFADGNGRTARLVEAAVLNLAGFKFVPVMLSNYYYQKKDEYFIVFNETRKAEPDFSPFLRFMLTGTIDSLRSIKGRIGNIIRALVMMTYTQILYQRKELTQRQFDLMQLIMNGDRISHVSDLHKPPFGSLYSKVGERTARRDLDKLVDLLLLTEDYLPNYVIAG